MNMTDQKCGCWRCWFQVTFTPLALFVILILSFLATVILMHEDGILDKYVTWLEGWDAGVLTSLGVALQGGHTPPPHTEAIAQTETAKVE